LNKKLLSLLLVILSLFVINCNISANEQEIKVCFNGIKLEFDVQPQIVDSKTMVPLRKIFETLGANVEWFEESQEIKATKGDLILKLQINNIIMTKNDQELILDVPPLIINGRTLVPVRAVAEAFDADVEWDEEDRKVDINLITPALLADKEQKDDKSYTILSAPGFPILLTANNNSWRIMIPPPYETVMSSDGNSIFLNPENKPDMLYVQIRDLGDYNYSDLEDIVKNQIKERLGFPFPEMIFTLEKDISKETINNLEYYTATIKSTMSKAKDQVSYDTIYFTIFDNQLFEFCNTTIEKDNLEPFFEVLNSFNPKAPNVEQ